ncbi:acyl carrier protein [Umezawaea tangerina]|uniref:Acyl carrier protein n=1 Tax=Umezawaea tangerina TaxID=84725 RepID=A0A2T0THL4_9PSEU|nr:acyl carrier protein [Umezawaea tangerina]PRY45206.1 acyl carrier protein [Umezawaea tangerina]
MSELINLVATVLRVPVDAVDDDTGTATTAAWSSLRHVEIVVGVEKTFGVRLTPREARSCRSVRALRDVLSGKGVTP